MPEIVHIPVNPEMTGLSYTRPGIVYSSLGLTCTIITPWDRPQPGRYPAVVFVQGSAWQCPDTNYELAQLAWYARHGYVVMTITHRNRQEGHAFPAFLEDTKCAIRYLRAHAEEYHVDKERIAVFGTSSGGNTAMLVQLTGDDPAYRTEEYAEESDSVCCAVECFGPSDMVSVLRAVGEELDIVAQLRGAMTAEACAEAMSPICRLQEGKRYPPILMLHGSGDPVVDYETQCLPMYRKYLQYGVDARLICVDGAPHEGPFWSWAVHEHILAFLDEMTR